MRAETGVQGVGSETGAVEVPPDVRWPWGTALCIPEPVFRATVRVGGYLFVLAVTVGVALAAAVRPVSGQEAYLTAWTLLSGLLVLPAIGLTVRAARSVAPPDRVAWRLWLAGLALMYLIGSGLFFVARHDLPALRQLGFVAVALNMAVFDASCLRMMRRRSGRRSLALDVVETLMASTLLLGAATLAIGDAVVTSPAAWFVVPCMLAADGAVTGLVWAVILLRRMPRGDRVLEALGVTLGVLAVADVAAQVAQGLNGFALPSAPLLALHALTMGMLVLLPLHVSRLPSTGLQARPEREQVRGSRVVTVLTLAAVPVLGVEALVVGTEVEWANRWYTALLVALVVLAALRNLLALDETRKLYVEVAEAADERRRLLADVMRSVDGDRRQAAAQLHRQAVASYSAFTAFVAGSTDLSPAGRDASARIQGELERAAAALGDLVQVVRPGGLDEPLDERLATVLRAHLERMPGDRRRPRVEVEVAEGIDLDWTTEALVVELLQAVAGEALETGASYLRVRLAAAVAGLEVAVQDDSTGMPDIRPPDLLVERAQDTMQAIVALTGGSLDVHRRPGRGVTTIARLGPIGRPRPVRPTLRVVRPTGTSPPGMD